MPAQPRGLIVMMSRQEQLVALTLGGVAKARASAARIACGKNLQQIGLALHNYHGQNGLFPPGLTSDTPHAPMPYAGWGVYLLPYLEAAPLWETTVSAFETNRNFLRVPPHVGLATVVPAYSCPADSRTRSVHPVGANQAP